MADVKYKKFFNNNDFLFLDVQLEHNNKKCLFILVNNWIKNYSEKIAVISNIFKLYHKNQCNIYIATVHPNFYIIKINSVKELLLYLCNISFTYGEQKYFCYDKVNHELNTKISWEKYVEDNDDLNLIIMDKHNKIIVSSDIKLFFKNVSKINTIDIQINIDDSYFDINSIKYKDDNIKHDNNVRTSDDIYELTYVAYGGYVFNHEKIITNEQLEFACDMYKQFFDIIREYPGVTKDHSKNSGQLNTLVGFCKEWTHYITIIKNIHDDSLCNSYLKRLSMTHIAFNKYKKMINCLKITNGKNIENKIEHLSNNIKEQIVNIKSDDSFFYSKYSLGGWKEEIAEKSCLGILMDVHVADYNRTGKWVDDVFFNNKTFIFLSAIDYINILNSNEKFNGNPTIIGIENLLLPIYINRYHWEISKCYIPLLLGFTFANNSTMYDKKMENIYYVALVEYFYNIVKDGCNNRRQKFKIWTAILRTCMEISKENGYHKGFEKYMKSLEKCKNIQINVLLGQAMSIGSDNLNSINEIIKKCNYMNDEKIVMMHSGIKLISNLKQKTGGFKNLINVIDNNSGILPKNLEDFSFEFINTPKKLEN